MKRILLVALLLLSTLSYTQKTPRFSYEDDNTIWLYSKKSYSVYDMQGKFVKTGNGDIIDLSDLSFGIYILILEIDGKIETTKIYKGDRTKSVKR